MPTQTPRKRAPSVRSLQTRKRILDAAEKTFAEHGFDGASLRDIAAQAKVPVGLVHHHGSNKEALFCEVVRRRATELSDIRIHDLDVLIEQPDVTLKDIFDCFFRAYLKLVKDDSDQWISYGRLVAHVSADARWRELAIECFDPTTHRFLDEILKLYPKASRQMAAIGQIFSVAAMLAFFNSAWRIETLSPDEPRAEIDQLVDFCTAGVDALLQRHA